MVKLTVMYNLPEGTDHEAFLQWRTGPHQKSNASMPKVLKTDFYTAKPTLMGEPAYRYITEAYFASMEDLENAFFTEAAQAKLKEDVKRIKDQVFLISEEVMTTINKE
ncbi:MAG: hypothetical protein KC422_08765 [Trueperaceae bacterium]|nr:hypothetical protein [Trueperaceae bacterium]